MVIEFHRRYQYDSAYYTNQAGDNSGEYVSLADYQKLEALLKRWNEIASHLQEEATAYDSTFGEYAIVHPGSLVQLIQDTNEAIK